VTLVPQRCALRPGLHRTEPLSPYERPESLIVFWTVTIETSNFVSMRYRTNQITVPARA
jgi:hypothetical protein